MTSILSKFKSITNAVTGKSKEADQYTRVLRSTMVPGNGVTSDNIEAIENLDYADKVALLTVQSNSWAANTSSDIHNYTARRQEMRDLSMQDEIENILDILCDDAIQTSSEGSPICTIAPGVYPSKVEKRLSELLKRVLDMYATYTPGLWTLFRRLLVDGMVAVEIVKDGDEILAVRELDAAYLTQLCPAPTEYSEYPYIWRYTIPAVCGVPTQVINIPPTNIVVIRYAEDTGVQRFSYVERLQRSFNVMRAMEASRVIWAVTNSSYKMQFTVPVGNTNSPRAMQRLAESCAKYREVVDFNWNTGECNVNGSPMLPFYKEYWFASDGQNRIDIQPVRHDGPSLDSITTVDYFRAKFYKATHIPTSRLDDQNQSSIYSPNSDVIREEIQYTNFISRLRRIFSTLFTIPLMQMYSVEEKDAAKDLECIDIHLKWIDKYLYSLELGNGLRSSQALDALSGLTSMTDEEGNAYFHPTFIVKKYLGFSEEDIELNERLKKKEGDAEPSEGGGGSGGGGGDAGGGAPSGGGDGGGGDDSGTPPPKADAESMGF